MSRRIGTRLLLTLSVVALPGLANSQPQPCPPAALAVDGQSSGSKQCPAQMLSQEYPGDVGIETDPRVVWAENFEQGSVSSVASRYDDVANSGGMSLQNDRPTQSTGSFSLRMQASGSGPNAVHLYKNLAGSTGGNDEWYVRYYVKYGSSGTWNHTSLWLGGYNPAQSWPNPQPGTRPSGNDRLSIALEPYSTGNNLQMDFYNYWRGMHSWMDSPSGGTAYYGNTVLHDTSATITRDDWTCVELHVKMNSDTSSATGGELGLWFDDQSIQQYDSSQPLGYWVRDKFCPVDTNDPACTDYFSSSLPTVPLDLQYRTTNSLKLNYLWLQNYVTDSGTGTVFYDDLVVATERVGCIQ